MSKINLKTKLNMFKMQISTEADTKNKNDATDKKGTS